jgi:hypothetical protein
MRRLVLFALFIACGPPAVISPPVVLRPTAPGANSAGSASGAAGVQPKADVMALVDDEDGAKKALEIVRSLNDEVGARLAGSPSDVVAVEWAERTMTGLGFSNVHREIVKVPRWERGVETASIVSPAQPLAVTALGGSVGTPEKGIEAEVVRVEDLDALDQLSPNDVRGRIVYLATVMEKQETMAGYGKAVGARVMGAIAAAKKGAVAVLVRSIGTDNNRLPHTGMVKMPEPAEGIPAIPAAAIAVPDGDMLERLVDIHKTVRVRLKLGCHRLPEGTSANVMGDITGHAKPNEIVLLGAHLDSWDLGRGALDDGAGVAIVLNAAHMVAQHRTPKRTLRVVLFAAEELSAAGARQYALDHAKELDKHVAAIEADQGDGEPSEVRFLGGNDGHELAKSISDNLTPLGAGWSEEAAYGGTDVAPLIAQGVPVVDIVQDVTRYFDYHHTANDTFDKIDQESISRATRAYAVAAFTLAESTGDLGRIPMARRTRK